MRHEAVLVPIECLRSADSPRLNGVDEAHARALAETVADLPAILVQRESMRVIDGMHRVRAAQLQQLTHIKVRYVDDDDAAAFLRGVAENIAHGLPLTLADRKAAAARIMEMNPEWSDRAVATAAGLSGRTVGALWRASQHAARVSRRKGRDGRVRPVNGDEGRQRAGELLAAQPEASLRKVAAAAGISPATVRKVRERMRRGEQPTIRRSEPALPRDIDTDSDPGVILNELRRDPALRYTEAGRMLLRWLGTYPAIGGVRDVIAALPAHCLPVVARLTRSYANYWAGLAQMAENRVHREIA